MLQDKKSFFLLLLITFSISCFLSYGNGPEKIIILAPVSACLGLVLWLLINAYTRLLASHAEEIPSVIKKGIILSLCPFILLLMVFVQKVVFLKNIRDIVLVTSLVGFAYLHVLLLSFLIRKTSCQPRSLSPFSKRTGLIFIFSLLIYTLFASGVIFSPYPITGDEPHYLLTTKSLLDDGDINLWNNYQNRDYLEFYQGKLDSHARQGKKGPESQFSRHLPALSMLLVPVYCAGSKLGGFIASLTGDPSTKSKTLILTIRLFLCGLTAGLSCLFYLTVRRLFRQPKNAFLSWAVFSFAPPMLFYSHKIYPEIPASVILLLLFWILVIEPKNTPSRQFLAGLCVSILPWLGIKYAVLSLGAFLLWLYAFKKNKTTSRLFFCFSLPISLSLLLFIFYLWSLYGNLSPLSVYRGVTLDRAMTFSHFLHLNAVEFFRCGVGYLLDQRVGLLVYAPVFFLFFPGVFLWIKKDKTRALSSLFLFVLYWAFCSLSYYWGGYSPPGRTLLPVLWAVGLFTAYALAENQGIGSTLIKHFFVISTFFITFMLLRNTKLLYHENLSFSWSEQGKFSNFLTSLSNPFIDLTKFVPSLSNREQMLWKPLIVWTLAIFFVIYLLLKKRKYPFRMNILKKMSVHTICMFVCSLTVIFFAFLHVHLDPDRALQTNSCRVYFQDNNTYGPEMGGFWVKGQSSTRIVVESPAPVSRFILVLSSPVNGRTQIQVGNSQKTVIPRKRYGPERAVPFPSPVGFPFKDGFLYTVGIKVMSGFVPSKLDETSTDNRFLGIFVKIHLE